MDKRTNEEWLADLRAGGDRQKQALQDLHSYLAQQLSPLLLEQIKPDNADLEVRVTQVVNRTISLVLENLDLFEGRSAFATWALKIGVREVLYSFRRQRWQNSTTGSGLSEVPSKMYDMLERDEFMQYIHQVFKEELDENQRMAIRAMIMLQMPKEEVMRNLGMERCEYFKMIHDARLRLKHRLEKDGWLLNEQGEVSQSTSTTGL